MRRRGLMLSPSIWRRVVMDQGRKRRTKRNASTKGPAARRGPFSSWCGEGGEGACGGGGRDWSALPGPALFCVLKCMARGGRLADLRAFACVCRTWRSSVSYGTRGELDVATYLPPLLVTYSGISRLEEDDPSVGLYSLPEDRCYHRKALQMPPVLLAEDAEIVGFSCGYLVVTFPATNSSDWRHHRQLFLVDPLADGTEATAHIELPKAPSPVYHALMTAPPTSGKDCVVVAPGLPEIQYYCLGGGDATWGVVSLPPLELETHFFFFTAHSVAIAGKIYILLQTGKVLVLEGFSLPGPPIMTVVEVKGAVLWHPGGILYPWGVAELNGDMLLFFEGASAPGFLRGQLVNACGGAAADHESCLVARLDLSRREWVRVYTLGDYSLFVGGEWIPHGVVCDGAKWGARKNCIYSLEKADCTSNLFVSIHHMEGGMVEYHHPKPRLEHAPFDTHFCWLHPTLYSCR